MKILVISHEYPPIGGGGGKVVQDLCEEIASEDHAFHVLTALWGNLPKYEESGHIIVERVKSHRTQAYQAGLITMGCFVWKSFWRSLKIIKHWHPDLIHAHFAVPGGASAALAGILTGTPYLITAHGGDVPGGAPEKTEKWFRLILPFTRFIWKNAARLVTVSEKSRQLAQEQYPVEIDIIPNGIDLSHYCSASSEVHDPPSIIYIGRFSPEKNASAVPEILRQLRDQNWKCVMVGDGHEMDLIQSLISEFQLNNKIVLLGWVSPKEVDLALENSDILLMPSLREGMPMAGLQGLASGSALVMSAVGACPDMIDIGKNGFLVHAGDIDGYAIALRKLLGDPELLRRYKKNSQKKARQFDIKKVAEAYKNIYNSIVRKGK